jgi:5,10-methylenetetrahydromethanopterin reductase
MGMDATATDPAERLGAYVLPGRVDDPRPGLEQARVGEQLGLGAVWLSERWDTKELGAVCGALSQVTSRARIIVGATHYVTRHPLVLAGLGSTMKMLSNDRFTLGVGRSSGQFLRRYGYRPPTTQALIDHATILRRLWAGESFDYDGPAGHYPGLRLVDMPESGGPPLLLAAMGPKALAAAGGHYDGVILHPNLTYEGVARSAAIVKQAAADAGRDPAEVLVYATVVVAPDLEPAEEAAVVGGRLVTYFQMPETVANISLANGWDPREFDPLMNHPMFSGPGTADQGYRREQLVEASKVIPRHVFETSVASGTSEHCAGMLHEFLAAGADHLLLHGATPDQCGPMIDAFRAQAAAHPARRA